MSTWVTSDLHFSHSSILNFCPETRPYNDATVMNRVMIEQWNDIVLPDDLTYIIGDVAFCTGLKASDILWQLHGRKILIKGNHDDSQLESNAFINCFESIHDILDVKHNGVKIVMCHYPLFDWKGAQRGSLHLFGHRHGNPTGLEEYRTMDVGVDATGNIVSNLDDVVAKLMLNKVKAHHTPLHL